MQRLLSIVLAGSLLFALASAGYLFYLLQDLRTAHTALQASKAEADAYVLELQDRLTRAEAENTRLSGVLSAEQDKTGQFEKQITDISGTIGTLQKLASTDRELLAKYSKVYFLNENYIPSSLSPIRAEYVFEPSRSLEIHTEVKDDLEKMLAAANTDGIPLTVASAYRSFSTQAALKGRYTVTYGVGANRFSADQGYSEHQLGTTVDLTTPLVGGSFVGFESSPAYAWLQKNAYRYGFILSYPNGNAYYQFEPWHWRYVGKELAGYLHDEDKNFYDLDQREIDTYRALLFE